MLNTLIGQAIPFTIAVILGAVAYGRLKQCVKDIPETMLLKSKLEIKKQLDQHCRDYTHDRNSGIMVPTDTVS